MNTQVLLIVAGYVHRLDPQELAELARSSIYLNAISNRLAASLPRSTLLGMIVGTAVSELVDPKERRMNFTAEEVDSTEGKWYRSLTGVQDSIGSISDLKRRSPVSKRKNENSRAEVGNGKPSKSLVQPASSSKIVSIEEIESDFASEEEDLPMYEKPDSDASDTDEDPTLVQRDKPSAPVYVVNLLTFFFRNLC